MYSLVFCGQFLAIILFLLFTVKHLKLLLNWCFPYCLNLAAWVKGCSKSTKKKVTIPVPFEEYGYLW